MTQKLTKSNEIEQYLIAATPGLLKIAPDESRVDGVVKSAILAISENDELKKCFDTPTGKISIYNTLKRAAATGLSLNPLEGKAALIAYGGKAQYQVMKNGLIELAMRSGKVEFITADVVRGNDHWEIVKGVGGDEYKYSPARKDRGEIDGFFAAITLNTGATSVFYMTKEEVEKHRDSYSKAKGPNTAWGHSFEGMGIKTILKRLFRNTPISSEMNAAIGADDKAEVEQVSPADEAIDKLKEKNVTEEAEIIEPPPVEAAGGEMF